MNKQPPIGRLETGVKNLDAILGGGLPKGSVTVFGGAPGSGKTIMAQQIGFHQAATGSKVMFIQTLSEPTIKTLLYLRQFSFFDGEKVGATVHFADLGVILKTKGLEPAAALVMEQVKRERPSLVVIDSFRVFDDMAGTRDDLRKFSYQLAVNMTAWECTSLLLGEFGPKDFETNPLFSVVDGLLMLTQEEQSGEQQRFLQAVKVRGAKHNRDKNPFVISDHGIEVFAPRVVLRPTAEARDVEVRLKTGVAALDGLLGPGIPNGSSIIVSGAAGTGKTLLLLEFIYRGAKIFGEKGLLVSFGEDEARLKAMARSFGWSLDEEIEKGLVEILHIPPPSLLVEGHLLAIHEKVLKHGYRRIAIDSLSYFLHKVRDPLLAREKVYQLATIIQNAQAVGLLSTDAPLGSEHVSRFGVEETLADGVILLTAPKEGRRRRRYIEVYKLRNTAHSLGQHSLSIGPGGLTSLPDNQEGLG